MDKQKQRRLEAAGWKVGTADEFLGLSPEESAKLDEMDNFLELSLKESAIVQEWCSDSLILLRIPFTTTDHSYTLSKLYKGRNHCIGQFWADSLRDAQHAVEAMYEGADVIFESTLNNTINLTASLDGICPADLDALDALYILELDGEYVAFFYKGYWYTKH